MPTQPLAACRVSTCPQRAQYRGLCRAHARLTDAQRGTSTQRGYDVYWRQRRSAFLLDHPVCAMCQAPATEADHLVTIKDADAMGWSRARTHADDNLRPLCKSHHSQRTARDQSGWGKFELCCTGAVPPTPPPIENLPTWG